MADPSRGKCPELQAVATVWLGLLAIYFMALRTGAGFAVSGFASGDTCWLLKLGQYISQSGIPRCDPFTYTLPPLEQQGYHFVAYQWLFERLMFEICKASTPRGLVVLGGIIGALTYLSLGLRACIRANAPRGWSFIAAAAASIAGAVRSSLRPEIASLFLLAITISLLQTQRAKMSLDNSASASGKIDWRIVAALALLAGIWCNLHSGFVYELLLLFVYGFAFAWEDRLAGRPLSGPTRTLLIALGASLAATLCNPYNLALWTYLPHLFFAPINRHIVELQPLWTTDAGLDPSVQWSCSIPLLCFGAIAFRAIKLTKTDPAALRSPIRLSSIAIALLATAACLVCRRFITVAAVTVLVEAANFVGGFAKPPVWSAFWRQRRSLIPLELAIVALASFGAIETGQYVPLKIPSGNRQFVPPLQAMTVFAAGYQGGRIFSGPEVGNMLDLYLAPKASIFIDSRFDAYSNTILDDWLTISKGRPGWNKLLDDYRVEWVFTVPPEHLGQLLEHQPNWELVYKDRATVAGEPLAMIFKRKS